MDELPPYPLGVRPGQSDATIAVAIIVLTALGGIAASILVVLGWLP